MSDQISLPEQVKQSSLLQSLADAIWRRIRQEMYELIQKAIYEGLDTIESDHLANAACGAGTPGTALTASATVPLAGLIVPFAARVVSISTSVYPTGGSSTVAVYDDGSALSVGDEIAAGSYLTYYLTASSTTEVLTTNVIIREL